MTKTYRQIDGEFVEVVRQPPGPRVYIQGDIEPYLSPIDNTVISSRSTRRDDLARSGCRPWEGTQAEQREADRVSSQQNDEFEAGVGDMVEQTFNDMKNGNIETDTSGKIDFTFGMD